MEEKSDLGKVIIDDMIMNMTEEEAKNLLEWIETEHKKDVLEIGLEYNEKVADSEVPQCVLDEQFGKGYILALRHMEKKLIDLQQ